MAQREARLSSNIVVWLNQQENTIARKRHGSPYGMRGDPDVYGLINGHHFEMEIKLDKNTPTTLQEKRLEEWEKHGAIVTVVWSLAEAKEFWLEISEEYK
jgi:hypothetical protein